MITIRIPQRAATGEERVMAEFTRRLLKIPVHGLPCRVGQHWQLDGNNDWTGFLDGQDLTLNARYSNDRFKERVLAVRVWIELWAREWLFSRHQR
jgi:hypothetical protein